MKIMYREMPAENYRGADGNVIILGSGECRDSPVRDRGDNNVRECIACRPRK